MDRLEKFDRDGDGMIENDGFPDQTYDTWAATGVSAYSGGLYVAALAAMREICRGERREGEGGIDVIVCEKAYIRTPFVPPLSPHSLSPALLDEDDLVTKYTSAHLKAQRAYTTRLWNGRYYDYDTSSNEQHDSIMADMMCGQWYSRACDLPPVDPCEVRERVKL